MKILYVCADLGIPVLGEKGAAVHVRAMTTAFARAGHQVSLVAATLIKSPWRTPVSLGTGVDVRHVPASRDMVWATSTMRAYADAIDGPRGAASEVRRVLYNQELLTTLDRIFSDDPPDFVYERASLLSTAGLTFAREAQVPHLLELNAPLTDEQRRYRQGGALQELAEVSESWVLRHTNAVLAVSAPLAEHVVALGADPTRVHVVPNGIDPLAFAPGTRDCSERLRLDLGPGPVLGFVGGLRPWHGVEQLPQLAQALRHDFPSLRIVVVGDGPLRASLAQQAERLGVTDTLRLVGPVSHEAVPSLLRQFDVAVAPYPPTPQPFYFSPLKVFEYMACGIPVVAPALGQLCDVIRNGETGVLYAPEDPDGLADACRRLLRAPEERSRMGGLARLAVLANYTWAGNATRAVELAKSLTPLAMGAPA